MTRPSPQTDRVIAVVDLMASRPGQAFTLAEISRRLGIHKQTCHSMLRTLTDAAWLVRHPTQKTYRLGPAVAAAGRAVTAQSPVLEYAHAPMHRLAGELDTNCILSERFGDHEVIIDAATPRGRTLSPLSLGQEFPLQAPLGGIYIAWAGEEEFTRWVGPAMEDVSKFRDAAAWIRTTGADIRLHGSSSQVFENLQRKLDEVGDHEDALAEVMQKLVGGLIGQPDELSEEPDPEAQYPLNSIAAPIFDHAGNVPYCLTAVFPLGTSRSGAEVNAATAKVRAASAELTRAVGGRVPKLAGTSAD